MSPRAPGSVAFALALGACSLAVSTGGLSDGPARDGGTAAQDGGRDGSGGTDGSALDGASGDAGAGCDPNKPFGALTPFAAPINENSNEYAGVLSGDLLTMYFASARSGESDLFSVTRPSVGAAWGIAIGLTVNSAKVDSNPWISADGLLLLFDSNRGLSGDLGIYYAERSSTAVPFGLANEVDGIKSSSTDIAPWISPDGQRIYFTSGRGGGTGLDIYVATKSSDPGENKLRFSNVKPVTELSSGVNDESSILSSDELTVFFATNRSGSRAVDIWVSKRDAFTSPFGAPVLANELNSTSDDYPTWLSSDGCQIIVQSYVDGDSNLYLATRPR